MSGDAPLRRFSWPVWPAAESGTKAIVLEALESGRWAVSGPYRGTESYEQRFCTAFAAYSGVPHCVVTANGSSALVAALEALGVGHLDEVLVPGLTWVACASAPGRVGARPVFVDLRPDGLTMCPDAAEEQLRNRPIKAIILVHQFCELADVDRFRRLADDHGIPLIEDCSQAHGAAWNGAAVGTFGDIGIFSMQQTKLLTCGEGGAAITRNADLHRRLMQLRADGRLTVTGVPVGQLDLVEASGLQGYNYCLSELHSALLLDGLRRLDEQNRKRESFAALLRQYLCGIRGVRVPEPLPQTTRVAYYRFCFLIAEERLRGRSSDIVADAIGRELGVQILGAPPPLPLHPLFRPWNSSRAQASAWRDRRAPPLPNAERVHRTAILIPHEYLLAPDDRAADIAAAVQKVIDNIEDLP